MVASDIVASALRLDIQGLRALAVVLVVIFHLSPERLTGGYVGVDVFFVISGYLITGHLLREVERTGTVHLTEFWARRVRRLIPAALLVLAVSAVAVIVLLPLSTRTQNLYDILFSGLYVVNWSLAANSVDYLGADSSASIAQHYWSLSVEEQFYIVWPVIILAAAWGARKVLKVRFRVVLVAVMLMVFAASLTFSILETMRSQPSAYFITTTRAWEFAAGGLVALLPALKLTQRALTGASWIAVGGILASAVLFDAKTPFPGWVALIPVAATAWLLYAGDLASTSSPQYLARAGWVQKLGEISYSLYLWHWPVIVVFVAVDGDEPGWKWTIVLVVVMLVLAALTKRFVEDPVRRGPGILARRAPTFAAMLAGMGVVAALTLVPATAAESLQQKKAADLAALVADEGNCFGAHAILNGCSPSDVPAGQVDPGTAASDTTATAPPEDHCTKERVENQQVLHCNIPGGATGTALFGNSYADHYIVPLMKLAEERDESLRVDSRTGCSGFRDPAATRNENQRLCEQWSTRVIDEIVNDPTLTKVVTSVRSMLTIGDPEVARDQLNRLEAAGKDVYVVRAVPGMADVWPVDWSDRAESAPSCVEHGRDCDWTPAPWDDWMLEAAAAADVEVLDSWDIMCDSGTCRTVVGGTIAYFDESHLTKTFATTWVPWFREHIKP